MRLADVVALDLRSLALLRIGVGATLLIDLAQRLPDLRAHYTDFGILPRAQLGYYTARTVYTLHGLASPSVEAVALLFALAALFAVALLLGWHTWLATLGSWLLLTSLQYRDPALAFGGDVMLRMLLFWGLFLPLGARWSLDARSDPARDARSDRFVSVASFALVAQVILVYAFTVLNRTGETWWNGDALHDALHFDQFASRAGVWLRDAGAPLALLTHVAIWFEGLAPLLLLSPIANGPVRTLAVALFLGFHATLGVLFDIGLFPLVFAVAWLGLLPSWFWERVGAARAAAPGIAWPRSPARDALAALALALVLLSNLSSLRRDPLVHRPTPAWARPAEWLYVDQVWGLFAPDPPIYDGWYAFLGVQADGRRVDPFWNRTEASFAKPPVVSETMGIRWREFFFRLQRDKRDPRWGWFGSWLCRRWNEAHHGPQRLDRAYVYYFEETTGRPGKQDGSLTLLIHTCE
jgi:hypothetical protein